MRTFNLLTAAAALLLCAGGANARQLTPEEALAAVPSRLLPASTRSSVSNLVYTQKAGSLNTAYIWASDTDAGYLVTAADDLLPALLGFADRGSFDPANIPPGMKGWLEDYSRQLEYAAANGMTVTVTRAEHPAIAPLCATQWGQDEPFNELTPASNNQHCPTGCTATAMAQVAKFHNYPVKGTGTNKYSYGAFSNLTFDFGNTEFQWDRMSNNYFQDYNSLEGRAVATLMAAIGNASLMQYDLGVSGAYLYDCAYGMVKFMGYDKGAYEAQRDYYTSADWDALIYGELEAKRPVVYTGYSGNGGGHSFVVDGYNGNGYYHLNWGWTGTSDGYFLLSGLDPKTQGTGGTGSGYNSYQSALIGIQPATANARNHPVIYLEGSLKSGVASYSTSANVAISSTYSESFLYCTMEDTEVVMGLDLENENGEYMTFIGGSNVKLKTYYGDPYGNYLGSFTIPGASFPEGTYYATPAFSHDGEVSEIRSQPGYSNRLKISNAGGTITIEQVAVDINLKATDIRLDTPLYSGKNCRVKAFITNEGDEYSGSLYPGLSTTESSAGRPSITMDALQLFISPGETREVSLVGIFKSRNSNATAGTYYLNLYDRTNKAIGTPVKVVMEEDPGSAPPSVSYEFPENIQGGGTSSNPYIVGNSFSFKMNVRVRSGYFDDTVCIYTLKNSGTYYEGVGDPAASFLVSAGQPESHTFELATSALRLNEKAYFRARFSGAGWQGSSVYIMRTASAVGEMEADSDAPVEYYTLQGIRVENPSGGIFIRRQGADVRKVVIR